MRTIQLNHHEISALFDSSLTTGQGGFQSLIKKLREKTNQETGEINLSQGDVDSIISYHNKYGSGGWQQAIKKVFCRHLAEIPC